MKTKKHTGTARARKTVAKKKMVSGGRKPIAKSQNLEEPSILYSTTSKIRPIGNSRGVILSNRIMEEAGISPDANLLIRASDGVILLAEIQPADKVNTNLSSWDTQFKKAIKEGKKPGKDTWENLENRFDEEEWT